MSLEGAGNGFARNDRVTPLVEGDPFRQQFGAQAVAGAGGGVDAQAGVHGYLQSRLDSGASWSPSGTGRNGAAARAAAQWPRRWRPVSAANTVSALRTRRTVPSGWWQAPRPVTRPAQRSR